MIMTIERKQVSRGEFRYIAEGNTEICAVKEKGNELVFKGDGVQLELFTFFRNLKWDGDVSSREAARYTTADSSDYLYDCGKKGKGVFNAFTGIYFWRMKYKDVRYEAFEVGFGRKGIYLCIYADDILVAMVSKEMKSKYYESSYTVYSEDNVPVAVVEILAIYWDFTRWSPDAGSESYVLNSWQKELKDKYDPAFIEKVKALSDVK